jgi:hypothetical protein
MMTTNNWSKNGSRKKSLIVSKYKKPKVRRHRANLLNVFISILYEVTTLSIYFTFKVTWRNINHEKINMINLKQERQQMEVQEDIETSLVMNQVRHKMYITFLLTKNCVFYHGK